MEKGSLKHRDHRGHGVQEGLRLWALGRATPLLAARYRVTLSTIRRWIHRKSPLDVASGPHHPRPRLTPEQRAAIRRYREENPRAGARTIAAVLTKEYGPLSPATIGRFLKAEGWTRPREKKVRGRVQPSAFKKRPKRGTAH